MNKSRNLIDYIDKQSYIEFRVYLKNTVEEGMAYEVGLELQDKIADIVSEENAPKIFTEDVTFEVIMKHG